MLLFSLIIAFVGLLLLSSLRNYPFLRNTNGEYNLVEPSAQNPSLIEPNWFRMLLAPELEEYQDDSPLYDPSAPIDATTMAQEITFSWVDDQNEQIKKLWLDLLQDDVSKYSIILVEGLKKVILEDVIGKGKLDEKSEYIVRGLAEAIGMHIRQALDTEGLVTLTQQGLENLKSTVFSILREISMHSFYVDPSCNHWVDIRQSLPSPSLDSLKSGAEPGLPKTTLYVWLWYRLLILEETIYTMSASRRVTFPSTEQSQSAALLRQSAYCLYRSILEKDRQQLRAGQKILLVSKIASEIHDVMDTRSGLGSLTYYQMSFFFTMIEYYSLSILKAYKTNLSKVPIDILEFIAGKFFEIKDKRPNSAKLDFVIRYMLKQHPKSSLNRSRYEYARRLYSAGESKRLRSLLKSVGGKPKL
jgi:hypothetical protein